MAVDSAKCGSRKTKSRIHAVYYACLASAPARSLPCHQYRQRQWLGNNSSPVTRYCWLFTSTTRNSAARSSTEHLTQDVGLQKHGYTLAHATSS